MSCLKSLFDISIDTFFVFPLSDLASIFCDKYYHIFPTNFVIPNACGTIEKYQNKHTLSQHLSNFGVQIPAQLAINTHDKKTYNHWNIFPAIAKPLASINGKKTDITIIERKEELETTISYFSSIGYNEVLLEEYICGDKEYMIEVLGGIRNGEFLTTQIIKKIREYPIKNGSTSYASLIESHCGLFLQEIKHFLLSINYEGLFDIEYKYADGKVYFIELNFRNGAPSFVFTKIGINLPYWWMNPSYPFKHYKKIIFKKFMVEQRDIINMLKKEVGFFRWIFNYLFSRHIFWMWRDTKPCVKYYTSLLRKKHGK